jgi:hypothetical protein
MFGSTLVPSETTVTGPRADSGAAFGPFREVEEDTENLSVSSTDRRRNIWTTWIGFTT